MRSIARAVEILFGLLFFIGVLVQYNDPDPVRWMAIYLAATISCFLAAFGKLKWWFAAATAVVALIWAFIWAPQAYPNVRIAEMFQAWEMKNERIEEGREMYGLFIICVCMTILAIGAWRKRAPTTRE
jgi:energy-coupling factor transporter transmembrane protein EcfT